MLPLTVAAGAMIADGWPGCGCVRRIAAVRTGCGGGRCALARAGDNDRVAVITCYDARTRRVRSIGPRHGCASGRLWRRFRCTGLATDWRCARLPGVSAFFTVALDLAGTETAAVCGESSRRVAAAIISGRLRGHFPAVDHAISLDGRFGRDHPADDNPLGGGCSQQSVNAKQRQDNGRERWQHSPSPGDLLVTR